MVRNEGRDEGPRKIDLERVAQLIDSLEQDLAKVQSGSRDVQLLRDEVETLKNVLNSPIRRHHWVREGLQIIDSLEQDLAKVQSGSRDVQLLRDEVETLKNVLNSPIRRHHWVREGLHGMRQAI